jgi:translation elongation factor P/translation initiation factor 5A
MKEIKLQGIYEKKQGKEVKDLKKGDIITWNYGYQSEVVEMIKSKTGKTFTVMLKSLQDGIVRERKMKATSLVVA